MKNRNRCLTRSSLVGAYSPEAQAVRLPLGKEVADPSPYMTMVHELVHRDLTDKTAAGFVDRLLAGVSGDTSMEPSLNEQVNRTFDEFFACGSVVHEAVATYVSGLYVQETLDTWDAGVWDPLPESYREDLGVVLRHLPGLASEPRPLPLVHGPLAMACAKAALNTPDLEAIIEAGPKSWEQLRDMLLDYNPAERLEQLLSALSRSGGLQTLVKFLKDNTSPESPGRDVRLGQGSEGFAQGVRTIEHSLGELTDSLERQVHEAWPAAGDYRTTEEKLHLYRRFVAYCNGHIFDPSGRPIFEIVGVADAPTSDLPRVSVTSSRGLDTNSWLATGQQFTDDPRQAVDWLENLARASMFTRSLILIHAREFMNVSAETIATPSGQRVGPLELLVTFDPWVNPLRPDGTPVSAGEAARLREICRGPLSVKADPRAMSIILGAIKRIGLHVFWHNDWRMGLATADGAIDPTGLPGMIRVFYLDGEESTTETFEMVARSLATKGVVSVTRSDLFEGAISPYVAWLPESLLRWAMLIPNVTAMKLMLRLKYELGARLDFDLDQFGEDSTDPYTHMALRYFYGFLWDDKFVYEDPYE